MHILRTSSAGLIFMMLGWSVGRADVVLVEGGKDGGSEGGLSKDVRAFRRSLPTVQRHMLGGVSDANKCFD
jgi:hypothetical protein